MEKQCFIVMPVKNGRHYIRRAIQSVMEQDYRNWSLIIVDDASVDGTSEAVQEFLSDQRIMYIYKEESIGVSKARNVALGEISRGGYVVFLDCDDCLAKDSIKNRIEQMEQYQADFGFFGCRYHNGNEVVEKRPKGGGALYSNNEFMERVADLQTGIVVGVEYVWDKVFDLQVIKEQNIRFNEMWDVYEDRAFNMDYLKCLSKYKNRILISETCVYDYYINQESISYLYDAEKFEKTRRCFLYMKETLEYFGVFRGAIAEGYYHGYINKIIGQMIVCMKNKLNERFENHLAEDGDFLEGLKRYECKNQSESEEVINILRRRFL